MVQIKIKLVKFPKQKSNLKNRNQVIVQKSCRIIRISISRQQKKNEFAKSKISLYNLRFTKVNYVCQYLKLRCLNN